MQGLADPCIPVMVEGQTLQFMLDTGARYSTICELPPRLGVTNHTVTLVGFSGLPDSLPLTGPAIVEVGKQRLEHSFVFSSKCPLNLMGRDLLIKCGACIWCTTKGLQVTFPDGTKYECAHWSGKAYAMLSTYPTAEQEQYADIYWAVLNPESPAEVGVRALFQLWSPWLLTLYPFDQPADPLHCTLYYDRTSNLVYQEAFAKQIEGHQWKLVSDFVYITIKGIAAHVSLTPEQGDWYEMSAFAEPHITLAIGAQHQAKDLGPMVKQCVQVKDWVPTSWPSVEYSVSASAYRIPANTLNSSVLEHQQISRDHGCEKTDHPRAESMLVSLPGGLWSRGPTDVGFCAAVAPVVFAVSTLSPVWQNQYRRDQEAEQGIRETIAGLKASGVLEYSQSSWNTPILPVEKVAGGYRMAHDLRRINAIVITPTSPVPNPFTALSIIDHTHTFFTVIDLANAFFCLPLAEEVRDIFSFTYEGEQLRYTRLPQGFLLSPGIFNQVLKDLLSPLTLPSGVVLIQYVDDLLLAAPTDTTCLEATDLLLRHLHKCGFKVSREKLQCCRATVSFLGRMLSRTGTAISPTHRESILSHPRPQTVRDILSFLGLAGYSRSYVADYGELTAPLRALIAAKGMRNRTAVLDWDTQSESAFISLKQALATAAELHRPDYTKPFYLDVSEKTATIGGVLFQKGGGDRQVLMYTSVQLDQTEKRHPPCTRYVAGLAKILQKTAHIVMLHPLTVLTTHSVMAFVTSTAFTLSPLRQGRVEKIVSAPHITYTHKGINMADALLEGEQHQCERRAVEQSKIRPELQGDAYPDAEMNLYTDGCCFRDPHAGGLRTAYAIVEQNMQGQLEVKETEKMEGKQSAQRAELRAVVRALELAEGKSVNVYTDSAYVCGVVHVELMQWLRAGFLTATGKPIKHQEEVMRLREALMRPSKVAVIKCKGHSKGTTWVEKGNEAADQAAKQTAGYRPVYQMMSTEVDPVEMFPKITVETLLEDQKQASPEEKTAWKANRASKDDTGLWRHPDGRPIPSARRLRVLVEEAHGAAHVGKTQITRSLLHWWHPHMRDTIDRVVDNCQVCQLHNVRPTMKPLQGTFPLPRQPGEEIQIDFTDMLDRVRGQRYLLVIVDTFTRWPEAYPCKREDAASVIKALVNQYIPTHGFPRRIRSDNGRHFKNKDLQRVEKILGLKHVFGTVYRPQSQGKVERMNQTLKNRMAKIMAETKLTWLDALPLALLSIRSSVSSQTKFTPYELSRGQQFPGPAAGTGTEEKMEPLRYKPYFEALNRLVRLFSKQVSTTEKGSENPVETLTTSWVYLKSLKRKWAEPRWTGPYEVTERTSHALRLRGKGATWFHLSQCAPAHCEEAAQDDD
nr:uncharacterized protein LOC125992617 [Syngnathus scovelli]